MPFFVMRCNDCGMWLVGEVHEINKYVLKCRYCRASSKLKKVRHFGLALTTGKAYVRGIDAAEECRKRNEALWLESKK